MYHVLYFDEKLSLELLRDGLRSREITAVVRDILNLVFLTEHAQRVKGRDK